MRMAIWTTAGTDDAYTDHYDAVTAIAMAMAMATLGLQSTVM